MARMMWLAAACLGAALSGCAHEATCEADVSPLGADLILTTVPDARVDMVVNKERRTVVTATGTEKVGTSSDEVEVTGCRVRAPKSRS